MIDDKDYEKMENERVLAYIHEGLRKLLAYAKVGKCPTCNKQFTLNDINNIPFVQEHYFKELKITSIQDYLEKYGN